MIVTTRHPNDDPAIQIRVGGLFHTFRTVRAGWILDLKSATAFRGDLVIGTLVSMFWVIFAIAPVLVAGYYLGEGAGWTQARLLFLQAIWYWMDAVNWVFCVRNTNGLATDIRNGRLDGRLLLPGDSLLRVMLGQLGVQDLPKFLIAIGLAAYAIQAGAFPGGVWHIIGFVVCLIAASVMFWAIAVLSFLPAITLFKFEGDVIVNAIHNLNRVPADLYTPWLHALFSTALPIVLITTVPSRVFFGWSPWWMPIVCVIAAFVLLVVLRYLWARQLRHYVGFQN
ncbi:MAG: ABC-2 family transporter protein [Propionibacteriaceae bacterium]|nr:ABC-2 family transporter protein [Propionibacteriaceae bacterium]